MFLFFDTETTGLDNPSMVQFGYILADDSLQIVEKDSFLVVPRKPIEDATASFHGITNEMVASSGVPMYDAFARILSLFEKADVYVGHNIGFDLNVLLADINDALGKEKSDEFDRLVWSKKRFCTMEESILLLRIPFQNGCYNGDGYKYPKLIELYNYLFGKDFENAHDAMADIYATYECYKEMMRIDYKKKIKELEEEEEEIKRIEKEFQKDIAKNIVMELIDDVLSQDVKEGGLTAKIFEIVRKGYELSCDSSGCVNIKTQLENGFQRSVFYRMLKKENESIDFYVC